MKQAHTVVREIALAVMNADLERVFEEFGFEFDVDQIKVNDPERVKLKVMRDPRFKRAVNQMVDGIIGAVQLFSDGEENRP